MSNLQNIYINNDLEDQQWLYFLATAIKDPIVLLQELQLPVENYQHDISAKKLFNVMVPKSFIARMQKKDPKDPLFLQVMPVEEEFNIVDGFVKDPLLEQNNQIPNLLHKYHNRVLLMLKNNCAINCRYCFRRHFPYVLNKGNKQNLLNAINYIKAHSEIEEVVLSGGDPLMAKDHELEWVIANLESISHVKRLRIHSRLMVVIPQRITDRLVNLFSNSTLKVVLVTHINHPNEIDDTVKQYFSKLKQANIYLLNQSVLLKNINDKAIILKKLSDNLFECGILPYYLHLLDKVEGASHFYIEDEIAQQIYLELQALTSGYLVPKLAREIAGYPHKTLI